MIISIDPSSRACGYCIWREGKPRKWGCLKTRRRRGEDWVARSRDVVDQLSVVLSRASWVKEGARERWEPEFANVCVIEMPAVWLKKKRGKAAARGGAVVKLAVCAGMIAGMMNERGYDVVFVLVATWKGQVAKEVTQRRVLRRYGIRGDHNMIDAVGIGDWYCRKRKRVRGDVRGGLTKKRTRA